ncbi:ABC transporter ATP-binding protein [Synechocystis sp. CACIAM 05]|uniref:ABC transporter ATP-binding protein n=1 Tax=Synechocystis sp. CACIAM 05 TaxID=1933929 RepID=UPI00138E8BDF|nr:ABC transporter ATP-binding protein [Synechocystis sp. CACIAM 05]QHU99462.1 protein tyrosine phosphatase [Synechocystis sp. CACIAM 05]
MNRASPITKAVPGLWAVITTFWPQIRAQWRLLLVAMVTLLADVGFRLLEPWPLKLLIDRVLIPAQTQPTLAFFGFTNLDPVWLLVLIAVGVIIIAVSRAIATYWNSVSLAIVGSRVMAQVRDQLYGHLQRLSLRYHYQARSGDLIIRVSSDANRLQEILLTAALPLVVSFLTLGGMVGVMAWLDLKLTLLSLVTFPLFWLAANRLSAKIRHASLTQRHQEGAVASTAAESLAAIKLVQALSLEQAFADLFSRQNQRSLLENIETKRLAANLERSVDVLIALGTALVMGFGGHLVIEDALTAGTVLVFLTYLRNAYKPVQNFAKYTGRLAKAAASGERILNILAETPDIQDKPGAITAPSLQGLIEFKHVSFGYHPDQAILKGLNLTVQPGGKIALVGASGSGKSTLLSLLLRLYDPTAGEILIDGHDLRNYQLTSLRNQMAVVLQESLLFAATIRENIAYGIEGATMAEIKGAARLANAHEFILELPQGYDTVVGERGTTLSGGQRQRLAIARAAMRQTPILILDEPTSGLDKVNEQLVFEALERLAENRTTFLVTHNLQLAIAADQILYLDQGQIREQGTHAELLARQGVYADLFQRQTFATVTESLRR